MSDSMSGARVSASEVTPELLDMLKAKGFSQVEIVGEMAEAPASPAPEAPAEGWVNVSGFECKREFTAWTSSNGIARHVGGVCKCKNGGTCKSVAKGHVEADAFNSRPGVELVKDEDARVFTLVG